MYLVAHHKVLVRDLKFAPDGSQRLLAGSRDGTLSLWDISDDVKLLNTYQGLSIWIFACAWAPNCDVFCGVGDRGVVCHLFFVFVVSCDLVIVMPHP